MNGESKTALVLSLLASDLGETQRFYEAIGFCLSGGALQSGWIEMTHGSARLQFYSDPPVGTPATPSLSGTIYLHVANVDALAKTLNAKYAFEWGPETMDYGMREFAVRDPSGYLVAFAASA
ncbi:MAG TPA: bleomycin resistance family protein [Parvularcula sp.]|jgi:catechol 2,3-dioxygenase-like lactoylglutathione lyase family enzyme|nr:bleomycin resistance family protein [Parvularcula sp.]